MPLRALRSRLAAIWTDFNWRLLSKNSGLTRIVGDIGSHWIDLAQYVTGLKITEVRLSSIAFTPKGFLRIKMAIKNVLLSIQRIWLPFFSALKMERGQLFVSSMQAGRKNKTFLTVAGKKCALPGQRRLQ